MTQKTIDALAKEFVEVNLQKKALEARETELKILLRKEAEGKDFMFEDLGMKVSIGTPIMETAIDVPSLATFLLDEGRKKDLLKVIKITKTDLTAAKLEDSAALAEKYQVEKGLKEAVVKLSPFSKNDVKNVYG